MMLLDSFKYSSGEEIYIAPVGENFAVVEHLNLQHLISVQSAGNGPSKYLKQTGNQTSYITPYFLLLRMIMNIWTPCKK